MEAVSGTAVIRFIVIVNRDQLQRKLRDKIIISLTSVAVLKWENINEWSQRKNRQINEKFVNSKNKIWLPSTTPRIQWQIHTEQMGEWSDLIIVCLCSIFSVLKMNVFIHCSFLSNISGWIKSCVRKKQINIPIEDWFVWAVPIQL